jgi:hypothetical protein
MGWIIHSTRSSCLRSTKKKKNGMCLRRWSTETLTAHTPQRFSSEASAAAAVASLASHVREEESVSDLFAVLALCVQGSRHDRARAPAPPQKGKCLERIHRFFYKARSLGFRNHHHNNEKSLSCFRIDFILFYRGNIMFLQNWLNKLSKKKFIFVNIATSPPPCAGLLGVSWGASRPDQSYRQAPASALVLQSPPATVPNSSSRSYSTRRRRRRGRRSAPPSFAYT